MLNFLDPLKGIAKEIFRQENQPTDLRAFETLENYLIAHQDRDLFGFARRSPLRHTLLMACIEHNQWRCFNLLVKQGIKIYEETPDGTNAVLMLADKNEFELADDLIHKQMRDGDDPTDNATKRLFKYLNSFDYANTKKIDADQHLNYLKRAGFILSHGDIFNSLITSDYLQKEFPAETQLLIKNLFKHKDRLESFNIETNIKFSIKDFLDLMTGPEDLAAFRIEYETISKADPSSPMYGYSETELFLHCILSRAIKANNSNAVEKLLANMKAHPKMLSMTHLDECAISSPNIYPLLLEQYAKSNEIHKLSVLSMFISQDNEAKRNAHIACFTQELEKVESAALSEITFEFKHKNSLYRYFTVLHSAVLAGDMKLIDQLISKNPKLLLRSCKDVNNNKFNPFELAVSIATPTRHATSPVSPNAAAIAKELLRKTIEVTKNNIDFALQNNKNPKFLVDNYDLIKNCTLYGIPIQQLFPSEMSLKDYQNFVLTPYRFITEKISKDANFSNEMKKIPHFDVHLLTLRMQEYNLISRLAGKKEITENAARQRNIALSKNDESANINLLSEDSINPFSEDRMMKLSDVQFQKVESNFRAELDKRKKETDDPDDDKPAILRIENEIKALILDQISAFATTRMQANALNEKYNTPAGSGDKFSVATRANDEYIVKFVLENKEKLLNGDVAALAEARKLFLNPLDHSHTAWRIYDPDSINIGYPNLLTQDLSFEDSYIMRKHVAYNFLAVTDTTPPFDKDRDFRIINFIGRLHDIRRGHNPDITDPAHNDSPACPTGHQTNIMDMANGHPKAQIGVDLMTRIQAQITVTIATTCAQARNSINTKYPEKDKDHPENDKINQLNKYQILLALTGMNHKNFQEIMQDPKLYKSEFDESDDSKDATIETSADVLVRIRKAFIVNLIQPPDPKLDLFTIEISDEALSAAIDKITQQIIKAVNEDLKKIGEQELTGQQSGFMTPFIRKEILYLTSGPRLGNVIECFMKKAPQLKEEEKEEVKDAKKEDKKEKKYEEDINPFEAELIHWEKLKPLNEAMNQTRAKKLQTLEAKRDLHTALYNALSTLPNSITLTEAEKKEFSSLVKNKEFIENVIFEFISRIKTGKEDLSKEFTVALKDTVGHQDLAYSQGIKQKITAAFQASFPAEKLAEVLPRTLAIRAKPLESSISHFDTTKEKSKKEKEEEEKEKEKEKDIEDKHDSKTNQLS